MDEVLVEDDETGFLVSNLGRIIGRSGKVLSAHRNRRGYGDVSFVTGNGKKAILIHRLVARNFIPNPFGLLCVNHKDEDPTNNRADNLEWCDHKYNSNYGSCKTRARVKRISKGSYHSITVERDGDVRTYETLLDCSKDIGVTVSAVSNLFRGIQSQANGWHLVGVKPRVVKRPVVLERDGVIKSYSSLSDASRDLGCISVSTICSMIAGRQKAAHGWKVVKS